MNRPFPHVAIICVGLWVLVFCIGPARAGSSADELLKVLQQTLKEKLQEVIADRLISYDQKRNLLEFSPLVLKFAAKLAKDRSQLLREFEIDPSGDKINFQLVTHGGTRLSAAIFPTSLDLDLREFTVRGQLPEGIQWATDKNFQESVMGFFDTLFGVPKGAGSYLKNFSFDNSGFRFTRPLKLSVFSRLLKAGNDPATGTQVLSLPLTMENGRLGIHLGGLDVSSSVTKLLVELLLMKLKAN